ncbi:hypothetical protein FGF59_20315 [Salmonella enterica subsp. enterica serovar 1,4,[5],12:i:-]|uniref:Cytochrome c assembly protein domain-containing protein n=1 Tax=Salmonella enterica subsp. enterica serovar 1,4,[5],12:i:- TaxID=2583588 RepID=A0A4P9T8A8_SALET|nr:hypothetical protein FGF59_20315 [Salmonella enterica subsp. enterica serovar 1,4,[5],12:i:-]
MVPGGRHGGARGLAAAVGAADERLDPAVAVFSRQVPADIVARVLAVMGMVCAGFLAFILFTSGPFARTLPAFPVEGRDLNPLLQDPGLIFHPPLLYMGYVGFSVAFAFAIAALLSGRLDSAFTRFARPWTLAAWVFLTLGIVLGSAWAYYELGWGGWWFWDPVENASFMPWLAGTALLHSLAVTEQRAGFKAWTLLLSICAFSLCLLGTFPGALRGAGVGARLRLRPGARDVYPRLYGAGHRRLAAAVRRARAQGAFAGEQRAVVARVAAARQQRPADGRHAGGAAGHPAAAGAQTAGAGQHFGGEPFFNTMFTADGPLCPAAGGGAAGALGPGPAA